MTKITMFDNVTINYRKLKEGFLRHVRSPNPYGGKMMPIGNRIKASSYMKIVKGRGFVDSFGYPLAGCSPAEPASVSPNRVYKKPWPNIRQVIHCLTKLSSHSGIILPPLS